MRLGDDDEARLEEHAVGLFEDLTSPEASAGEGELWTPVGSPVGSDPEFWSPIGL